MPSKSEKQARLMAAVAHSPKFAKKVGIPQSVGRDFYRADQGYEEGGRVLPSSTDDEESWSDTYIKRPLSGLASMWGATDPETGEFVNPAWHNIKRQLNADSRRKAGLPRQKMATMGLVDEAISLPALGEIVGLPAPQFAKDAEERSNTTRNAARESLGLDDPHGFVENLTESAGVMAGQLPVPASWANKLKLLKESGKLGKAGKILGPAAEWFSPTVVPKVKNYVQGTLFGGGIGGTLDYLEDRLDERHKKEQNEQFVSEAIAEVLEEERVKAAQESGDDTTDDEALAELGYAEGGRVKQAKRLIGGLRSILSNADPDDVATRKAAIDQVLHAIKGTTGPSEMDRQQLYTMSTGLADAAADIVPERRRQRFGDYERNVLNLLEGRVAPQLTEQVVPSDLPMRRSTDLPAPPPLPPALGDGPVPQGTGTWTPEEYNRIILKLKGYATGGKVTTNTPWGAPQTQKNEPGFSTSSSNSDSRSGAPLSQEWYETYGEGPEHLFLGDRTVDMSGWQPIKSVGPKAPPSSGGGSSAFSNLAGLASLGLMGYDVYKDIWGNDTGNINLDDSILAQPIEGDTTWLDEQFAGMPMPTAEYDPSLWDRTQQGAGGALDLYTGSQQGGVSGLGSMIGGGGDLYAAFGGQQGFADIAGDVGGILQGVGDGSVQGYLQAGGDAAQLANAMGYTGAVMDSAGKLLPVVGQLFSAYEGIKRGDPAGYLQAAGSLYGAASGAGLIGGGAAAGSAAGATAAGGTAAAGSGLGASLASSGLAQAAPLAALGFAVADASNYALEHNDRRNALYASRMQFAPVVMPNQGRTPGGTFYQMSNGKIISQKDMEWLSRLSKDTGKGNTAADEKHAKAVQDLMADTFHSDDFNARQKKWLDANGYTGKY